MTEPNPREELFNLYYEHYKESKDSGVDMELYELAHKDVDKIVDRRAVPILKSLEFNINSHNSTSHTAVTQLILATSVGIALIANAVNEFHARSAVLVSAGISCLIVSLIFGWMELNRDKRFHAKNIEFYNWAIDFLYSFKYKSFEAYDKKKNTREKKEIPENSTPNNWFYLQAFFVLTGFVFIFLAMLDLWNVPSYIWSRL